jgi:hypothetical protein
MRAAELRASYRWRSLLVGVVGRVDIGARAVRGLPDPTIETGRIDVTLWSLGVRASLLAGFDRLQLEAGLGGRAGLTRLRGESFVEADESSFVAPAAMLSMIATARAWATDRVPIHISVETGVVVAGVDATASGRSEHVLGGLFVGVTAGTGVSF